MTSVFTPDTTEQKSRDSSVSKMGYGLDDKDSIPDRGKIFLPTPQRTARPWGSPTFLFNENQRLFPPPKREADYTALSNAEVQNCGVKPPLPHTSSWFCS
jgi:hypothetical protein